MHRLPMVLLLLPLMAFAQGDGEVSEFERRLQAAMAAESRPESHRERDDNRLPVETLAFFGLDETMKVLELIPGGGWYTRLLAPALKDSGTLYVALAGGIKRNGLLQEAGFEQVELLEPEIEFTTEDGARFIGIAPFDFGVTDLDAVLTFRNLHNLNEQGRDSVNRASFAALRPGGIYGVVDHTRRHMEPAGPENRRRVDPVLMIQEIQAAGFEFAGFSDLHYRADDELRFEVGRKSVTGNSDRFTLLFRKPGQ